jgi:hypothetical protein
MTEETSECDYKSIKSNATHMRSFRVSEQLEELIMNECKRRNTDVSKFIRDACLDAICNRPWQS